MPSLGMRSLDRRIAEIEGTSHEDHPLLGRGRVIEMSPSADADKVHMAPRQQISFQAMDGAIVFAQRPCRCAVQGMEEAIRQPPYLTECQSRRLARERSFANPSQVIAAQFSKQCDQACNRLALYRVLPRLHSLEVRVDLRFPATMSLVASSWDGNGKPNESNAAVPNHHPLPQPTQQTTLQPYADTTWLASASKVVSDLRANQPKRRFKPFSPGTRRSIVTITRGFKIQSVECKRKTPKVTLSIWTRGCWKRIRPLFGPETLQTDFQRDRR